MGRAGVDFHWRMSRTSPSWAGIHELKHNNQGIGGVMESAEKAKELYSVFVEGEMLNRYHTAELATCEYLS